MFTRIRARDDAVTWIGFKKRWRAASTGLRSIARPSRRIRALGGRTPRTSNSSGKAGLTVPLSANLKIATASTVRAAAAASIPSASSPSPSSL